MASMLDRLRAAQPISAKEKPVLAVPGLLISDTFWELPANLGHLKAQTLAYLGLNAGQDIAIKDFLFMDTETSGLRGGAGTVAFLIGAGWFEESAFHIRQYLMRDYHQEAEMLTRVFARFAQAKCLVTYNGASFDMPLLEGRATVNRLQESFQKSFHLDLVHAARRIFKLRIRQCSLCSLEERIFGIPRENDLGGADIPARFFEYLKSRDEGLMDDVLSHNQLDIISLARLLLLMGNLHDNPMDAKHHMDIFSIGKVYEKHGQVDKAASCFRACTDRDVKILAEIRLADMYKRCGNNLEAAKAYETVLGEKAVSYHVCTALAKIYEHRLKEPSRALAIVNRGMLYCAERRQLSAQAADEYAALEHRYLRLKRKVDNHTHGTHEQTEDSPSTAETPAGAGRRSTDTL